MPGRGSGLGLDREGRAEKGQESIRMPTRNSRARLLAAALAPVALAFGCAGVGNPRLWTRPIDKSAYCAKATPYQLLADNQRALAAAGDQLKTCYADLSLRVAEASGTMEAEVTLAPDGTVTDACITEATTLNDHAMAQCVLAELRAMRFSPPGKPATALLPLEFRPTAEPVPYRPTPPSTRDLHCDPNPEFGTPCTGAR
jgi:hypothetical protein